MILKKMGPEHWAGAFELRRWDPPIDEVRDVYCLPYREGGQWGVFDAHDRIIPGSINREHSDDRLLAQDPTSYASLSDIEERLPDGDYLYGGRYSFHFGHFLIESLTRLWPLAEGKRAGQKVIVHGGAGGEGWFGKPFQAEILRALDLAPDDLVYADRPFRIDRLTVPHMSFQQMRFGSTAYRRLCRAIGSRLVGGTWPERNFTPVWLSKSRLAGGVRRLADEERIEEILARNGVEIVHPQDLTFTDKVRLFGSRHTIMGTLQSVHNVSIFAPPVGRLISIFPYSAIGADHITIDYLNDNNHSYFLPEGSRETFHSGQPFMVTAEVGDPAAVAEELLKMI